MATRMASAKIPPLAPETKAAVKSALEALGHRPSVAECQTIATKAGCSPSTVRRLAGKLGLENPAQERAGAKNSASPKAKAPAKERAPPAIRETVRRESEPGDTGQAYRSDECCGATWSLGRGEAMPGSCPGCGAVFA